MNHVSCVYFSPRFPRTLAAWLRADRHDIKWLALIVFAALVVRLVWVFATLPTPNWDADHYDGLLGVLLRAKGM